MTLLEAHKLALKVLKQVMEEKLDENNVQLAQVIQSPIQMMNTELMTGDIGWRIRDSIRGKVEGSD
jgi:hypothetical protein